MMHASHQYHYFIGLVLLVSLLSATRLSAQPPKPTQEPLLRTVDIRVGDSQKVSLCNGLEVEVKLLKLTEKRGEVFGEVEQARVLVEVDGKRVQLTSSNYNLPLVVGRVKIDCAVTKTVQATSHLDRWGLEKDARLRLWPADSPLVKPGSFVYPIKNQKWFSSTTQMANEPIAPRKPGNIYYHWGLDFGGSEGNDTIVSVTDALIVSVGEQVLPGYQETPVDERYDVVYLLDARGWYYRYSHMKQIDPAIVPGRTVKAGQLIGTLGKEGGSGGWTHQHIEVMCRQPSGKWGTQASYAFCWEAYLKEYQPDLIAVARPSKKIYAGSQVELDASRSWSKTGTIQSYQWTFADGTKASGAKVVRRFEKTGRYHPIVKITDAAGNVEYDFMRVYVFNRENPFAQPPRVHAAYYPTRNIRPGDKIEFSVRVFGTTHGQEEWDFGDGSRKQYTKSNGKPDQHAKDGYAKIFHSYKLPGDYIVRVQRANERGERATEHLHVHVVDKEHLPR